MVAVAKFNLPGVRGRAHLCSELCQRAHLVKTRTSELSTLGQKGAGWVQKCAERVSEPAGEKIRDMSKEVEGRQRGPLREDLQATAVIYRAAY